MGIYRFYGQKPGNRTSIYLRHLQTNATVDFCFNHRVGGEEIRLLGWNVPAHELHTIPDYWLTYPEPPASLHYLLGMLYVAFTFVALIGNGLVIWVFSS